MTVSMPVPAGRAERDLPASFSRLRAADIMQRDLVTAQIDDPLSTLERIFADERVSGVPVLDGDERLVGILSMADLVRRYAEDCLVFESTPIGAVHLTGRHDGRALRGMLVFLQGFCVKAPSYYENDRVNVVHLDPRQFIARLPDRDTVTWKVAVGVGLAQVVAGVFPGTSRSAAAIFLAMLLGLSRRSAAAEFVFLVGIPTMFAASGYAFLELLSDDALGGEDWTAVAVAFVAAAATGFAVVRWLMGYIKAHRFTGFAIYRIVLGLLLLALMPTGS